MWRGLVLMLVVVAALLAPLIDAQEPTPVSPFVDRFELLPTRPEDQGPPVRVARFIHSTDVHILDDDAPYPLRQEELDALGFPFTSAQRPQEEYTDEAFNSIMPLFNLIHLQDPVDFVVFSGDNIDNTLENELVRFIDNLEGSYTEKGPISNLPYKPDGQSPNPDDTSKDVTDAATSLPDVFKQPGYNVPLLAPYVVVFGNHDSLIQGNAPIEPSFQEYAARHGRYFVNQQEYIALFFKNQAFHGATKLRDFCNVGADPFDPDDGHGFQFAGARLCDDDPDNDGYYSFQVGPITHIVLDTMNDDFVQSNGHFGTAYPPGGLAGAYFGGYSEGTLDPDQFAWLKQALEANKTRLVVVHAHHTVNSFVINQQGASTPAKQAGYVSSEELVAELNKYPNVAFFVGGHTHQHRIQPKGTFWNVETASLIDPPHENRIVEIYVAPNKTGFLQTLRIPITFAKTFELSKTDTQADANAKGAAVDRDVRLWFAIPDATFAPLRAQLDRRLEGTLTSDVAVVDPGAIIQFEFNVTTSFTRAAPPDSSQYSVTVYEAEGPQSPKPMVEGGSGGFSHRFAQPGSWLVEVVVAGPDVEPLTLQTFVDVRAPPAEPTRKADQDTPGPGAASAVLALVAGLVASRSRAFRRSN